MASAIENSLNGGEMGSVPAKVVFDFLGYAHRYLQGEFFKFVMKYIKINAIHYKREKGRWFDPRNEYSGIMCVEICKNMGWDTEGWEAERLSAMEEEWREACVPERYANVERGEFRG